MDETIPINDECVICYNSITNNDYIEPCKHPVHHQCFLMTKKNICPVCRQIVTCPSFRCNIDEYDKLLKFYHNSLIFFTISIYVFFIFFYLYHR
jgi:hypothetical protein